MKKNYKLIIVIPIVILLLLALFLFLNHKDKQDELTKIYSTFTCNCCEGSLMANKEFCARGIKEEIKEMQTLGIRGAELFDETTQLLGIENIIDVPLRTKTHNNFVLNPPSSRAIIELNEDHITFGNVSESKTAFVMKDFKVKNAGQEDLFIYQVTTSCSCLTAKFVNEQQESPHYGRFSFPYGLTIKIEPGEDILLRVTYDSRVNSYFRGFETRFVYIHSNDVLMYTKQISIDVNHID